MRSSNLTARFALPRTQVQAQPEVIAQVVQDAALRLHTIRPRVLIGLHRVLRARVRGVGQGQISAVGGQQAMSAPPLHLVIRFIKLIEACAETALEMRKHFGFELLPRV